MKKYGVLLILVCLMFIVGCVSGNYFKVPTDEDTTDEESELIKEIQEIEKQIKNVDDTEEAIDEKIFDEEATDETIVNKTDEAEENTSEVKKEAVDVEEEIKPIDTSSLEKLTVQETDLVSLKVDVDDKDNDKVTYTFSKPLDTTGKWQTQYGDSGEYIISITANDGKTTSEKKVLLIVKKKNVPPEIKGLESTMSFKEGDKIVLSPKISDPNKDAVEITFPKPFNELGIWETDHTSAGEYDLLIKASDGEMETKFSIKLTVKDVNVPPVISELKSTIKVKEGEKVLIKPKVTDLDGDKITVTISEPVGDDGVWETDYTDHGNYKVIVTATDGKDTVTFNIDLVVEDVNVPPEIIGVRLN